MTCNNRFSTLLFLNALLLSSFVLFAFMRSPLYPPQDKTVTLTEALALHKNYDASTSAVQARVEGVYLDREALNELVSMLESKPNAAGVRIYFGKDKNGANQNILVTTNENRIDDTGFLMKSAGSVALCPTICDAESPFVKQ